MAGVQDIPTAHTPPGGYGDEMPAPVLGGCTDPLRPGVPDLRGTWKVITAHAAGAELRHDQLLAARQHHARFAGAGLHHVGAARGVAVAHQALAPGVAHRPRHREQQVAGFGVQPLEESAHVYFRNMRLNRVF